MPEIVAYAYPWDVIGAQHLIGELRDLGVTRVAVAAYYHGVRAATPRHPDHRVVTVEHSALYTRFDPKVWEGAAISPPRPDADKPGMFESAADSLAAAGIEVDAWIAPTHADGMTAAPAVTNAFGDRYEHALCPNAADVRDFAARLGRQVASTGVRSIVAESLGQLGIDHAGLHEKTAGADWSASERALLSVCVCRECAASYRSTGVDDGELAARIRLLLDRAGRDTRLPDDMAAAIASTRREGAVLLGDGLIAEARLGGVQRISVHTSDRDDSTTPATAHVLDGVDCYIAEDWSADADGAGRVRRVRDRVPSGADLGAYVTLVGEPAPSDRVLADHWRELDAIGVDELHIYHIGLTSYGRLQRARAAIDELREAVRRDRAHGAGR